MTIDEQQINFTISNFIKDSEESKNKNSGFGLPNIRRRLDLLFENKYVLDINSANKKFSVKLILFLS